MMILLAILHATAYVVAPILSTRTVAIGPAVIMLGLPLAVVAHGLRDVIQERNGPASAHEVVLATAAVRALWWGIAYASGIAILREAFRIALAGEAGLLIGQMLVARRVFAWARARTHFRWAYNVAQFVSEVITLAAFVIVANVGTARPVLPAILGGLLVRLAMSIALTPAFAWLARAGLCVALLSSTALAQDWSFNSTSRVMAGDAKNEWRLQEVAVLQVWRLRAHELLTMDRGSDKPNTNSQLTLGFDVLRSRLAAVSTIYQRQDTIPASPLTGNRYGLEVRVSLP